MGDDHGRFDELVELTAKLGYTANQTNSVYSISTSGDRKLVLLVILLTAARGRFKSSVWSQVWCNPATRSAFPAITI